MSIRYKIIASILFLQSNILSAEGNSSGEISLSEAEISIYSEKALIQAVEYVRNNEINKAIEELNQLLKTNPSFNAAQLMYADLMLSRSKAITDFGNITSAPFNHIDSLLTEVKARWDFHKNSVDKNKIPSSLIKLANTQSHVIVVDAQSSRLFLFENDNGVPKLKSDFYVTIGKNGTGKYTEGDQKTPIGVYFVTGFIPSEDLPDLYGDGAFPINYPNAWDQRHNRTGYGIWLHGTPSKVYSRAPKDSNGCVIVSNNDLNTLNSKEKNIVTVDLTNDEKIVFSQLGINPLIKLGKEYLTNNNFVRLKENSKEQEKTLNNKKTKAKQIKKISTTKEEIIDIKIETNSNSKDKSTKKTNENNEVIFKDNNDEIELTNEINNARKKRRRSSASIE